MLVTPEEIAGSQPRSSDLIAQACEEQRRQLEANRKRLLAAVAEIDGQIRRIRAVERLLGRTAAVGRAPKRKMMGQILEQLRHGPATTRELSAALGQRVDAHIHSAKVAGKVVVVGGVKGDRKTPLIYALAPVVADQAPAEEPTP